MRKIKTKLLCVLAAVLIIFMYNVNGYETPNIADIEATLRPDIPIKLDREIQTLKDGNGTEVYPLMYNNTTYIPVRSVGIFLDKVVSWDGTKNVINIEGNLTNTEGEKERTETYTTKLSSNIKAILRPDITIKVDREIQTLKDGNGVEVYPIMYNNTTYIPIRSVGAFLGKDVNWDNSEESVYIGAYLTDIQVVGTRVDYIKLFDNCVHPLTGEAETLESMDPYETDRKATCFDSVKLDLPLLIETDNNGNKNIIYDIYFQEDGDYSLSEDSLSVKKYNLVIKKNQCSLFYGSKFTSLVTNITWCYFVYQSDNYPEKYVLDASRSIERVSLDENLVSMVKNDIFEYAVPVYNYYWSYGRTMYNYKDLKKVIFQVADDSGYSGYKYFSVDVNQIRTVTK